MGRPQVPLIRDGSPRREFAFWLRDLRARSALTYEQLGRSANYATSTMQEAASGERLPTLPVVRAYVRACGGDLPQWEQYWAQIKRAVDPDTPRDLVWSVDPPWLEPAQRDDVQGKSLSRNDVLSATDAEAAEGWYLESLVGLLRLDAEPIEAIETRVIVATADDLTEIATSISLPRHPGSTNGSHSLDAELLYGGSLEEREQPFQSFFRNVVALSEPLHAGDRHQYAIRLTIPHGQPMLPHYVHVPLQRSEFFDMRVRFDRQHPPQLVWKLDGVSTTVLYEHNPGSELVTLDEFGEVRVTFSKLRQGLSYGVSWMP